MDGNKKPQGVGEPQAVTKSFTAYYFTQLLRRVKATVYMLAPWLFFMGALHG